MEESVMSGILHKKVTAYKHQYVTDSVFQRNMVKTARPFRIKRQGMSDSNIIMVPINT